MRDLLKGMQETLRSGANHLRPGPLYPFLFLLYTLFTYETGHLSEVTVTSILALIMILLFIWFLSIAILKLCITDTHRRSLVALLVLLPLFGYGELYESLGQLPYHTKIFQYHLPTLVIATTVLLGSWWAIRVPIFSRQISKALTLIGTILVGASFIASVQTAWFAKLVRPQAIPIVHPKQVSKPDIYYLVFDEYTGPQALKKLYGFDDKPFLDQVRSRGFFVSEKGRTNYIGSLHSLASTLNMDYLDPLTDGRGTQANGQIYLQQLMDYSRLGLTLKNLGYHYYINSWWQPTRVIVSADRTFPLHSELVSQVVGYLQGATVITPVLEKIFPTKTQARITKQEQSLKALVPEDGPKFVFVHFLLPHAPYVFGAHCEKLDEASLPPSDDVSAYLNQLQCANQKILETLDMIKATSPTPPVILLQSDEGEELTYPLPQKVTDSPQSFAEKFSILSAYYFPDHDYASLFPNMTPVNRFRVVLNKYFGTDLPFLERKEYLFDNYYQVGGSVDVTKEVSNALPEK